MTTTQRFIIKTASGYVGRDSLSSELADTMPRGFAYTWTADEAETIAERFNGQKEAC